ncbi:MAG: Rrf2 family transcriptional regulator [Oscillospiraceae bacterium]
MLLITRETDYGLRLLRGLSDGQRHTVGELSQQELVPQPFAYKILKKLSHANLVAIQRGAEGGCRLKADLAAVTLYDLLSAMEEDGSLISCMDPDYSCALRLRNGGCAVHGHMAVIQRRLDDELRAHLISDILAAE